MKALVALSGGMDSTSVLGKAILDFGAGEVEAIGFFYGSKHNPFENEAAAKVAEHYGVPFRLIDLSQMMAGFDSALTRLDKDVPEGFYEAENMRQTVVPGRNLIFIAHLTGIAQSNKIENVYLGIHSGDHFIYPDCRPNFFYHVKTAVGLAYGVTLVAPFLDSNKTSIIAWGMQHSVPYQLTRTCYKAQEIACGKCGSCQERLDAFKNNGLEDPIEYESRVLIPKSDNVADLHEKY